MKFENYIEFDQFLRDHLDIFTDYYLINDKDTVRFNEEICIGGQTNTWTGATYYISPEFDTPIRDYLLNIVSAVVPTLPIVDFKVLKAEYQMERFRTVHDYYGGEVGYKSLCIETKKLFDYLKSMGYLD